MSISSYPFDGQDTTEDQYTKLFAELQRTGVAASADSGDLKVTAAGSSLTLDIAPGKAYVRGHFFESDAIEHLTLTAPVSGSAIHVVVLRLNPATNSISLAVVQGVAGAGYPQLADSRTTNATGIFELALASIAITSSTTSVVPGDITDDRTFVGRTTGTWSRNATRPKSPRSGDMGYNLSSKAWEFWDGTLWTEVNSTTPGTVEMTLAATAPAGYLLLDGSTYNVVTYPRLAAAFGAIGSTFTLPDFRNRMPFGAAAGRPVGSKAGSEQVTLTTAQLPAHKHTINHNHTKTAKDGEHDHNHYYSKSNGSVPSVVKTGALPADEHDDSDLGVTSGRSAHEHSIPNYTGDSGNTGNGNAVSVLNPFLAVNFIVKT